MSKGKSGTLALVCVAAIALFIGGGFVVFGNPFAGEPKESVAAKTTTVFPERGYAASIVKEGEKLSCDPDTASTLLADSGGTVSVNGLLVSSEWTEKSVTVTFDGQAPFVSGYVIGEDGSEPFVMPDAVKGEKLDGIILHTKDFSESGAFKDIVLCGGGL